MCGIFVTIRDSRQEKTKVETASESALRLACNLRGPDAQSMKSIRQGHLEVDFYASELHLRGQSRVVQPHSDSAGNILCWNGEIFGGINVTLEENDGKKLLSLLSKTDNQDDVVDILAKIEGPYALVYWQAHSSRLFIARDCLGRRSLLVHPPTDDDARFYVASVVSSSTYQEVEELSTSSIFCVDLGSWGADNEGPSAYSSHRKLLTRSSNLSHGLLYAAPSSVNTDMPPSDLVTPTSLDEEPEYLKAVIDALLEHLDQSVCARVRNIPAARGHARLAILFSGGIDCTALAYFAHKYLPPGEAIDLLNVSFENPRKTRAADANTPSSARRKIKGSDNAVKPATLADSTFAVPDRISGLSEVEELKRQCPGRIWNFVNIDITFEECQAAQPIVEALMFPRNTVMDLSLANALYFAARGVGYLVDSDSKGKVLYTSTARVLLSGLGSDELLGGYGRHRTTFKWGSWSALIQELQTEIDRIPVRNLGRDDRVISCHGKECRYPFLSLDTLNFLAGLPVYHKLDPRAELGVGDKMLLRLAMRRVGLVEASGRHKKAMQFGSHSARMLGGAADKKGDIVLHAQ